MTTTSNGGAVARILNPLHPAAPRDDRRIWLEPGQVVELAHARLVFTLDTEDGAHVPRVFLNGLPWAMDWRLDIPGYWASLPYSLGVHIVPLALEYDRAGIPQRLRVQFVRVHPSMKWSRTA